ncbi:hypothetical protein TorRG33x02_160120 [Trema orientale]|uniref:Uncharacterized protein n=1 Tax=Trema orientale TaxID=63057 RepID=A0A2P5ERL5_TREOI|nr:hypothetical protein TorRG33x02_160120 [Trema orientale]
MIIIPCGNNMAMVPVEYCRNDDDDDKEDEEEEGKLGNMAPFLLKELTGYIRREGSQRSEPCELFWKMKITDLRKLLIWRKANDCPSTKDELGSMARMLWFGAGVWFIVKNIVDFVEMSKLRLDRETSLSGVLRAFWASSGELGMIGFFIQA